MAVPLSYYARALTDFFLPGRCVVCDGPLSLSEKHICLYCDADFPQTRYAPLKENPMADRYNAAIAQAMPFAASADGVLPAGPAAAPADGAALSAPSLHPYEYASALFFYDGQAGYSRIPQALKYDGRLSLGRYFAARLGTALAASPLYADVDVIVPVPLHWRRHFHRGYNQAAVIAREVARRLGEAREAGEAPAVREDWLRRVRSTHSQATLPGDRKRANVSNAFAPAPHLLKLCDAKLRPDTYRSRHQPRGQVVGRRADSPRHILLVDDVFTTGSTLADCHRALRSCFPSSVRISAATLAFVREA